jgi:hypothetical protein
MSAPFRTIPEVRVLTTRVGDLLGPEYLMAVRDRYFKVGELTKTLLLKGYDPDDLDLVEVDPDAEDDEQ